MSPWLWVAAVLTILLDQGSKAWVLRHIPPGGSMPLLPGVTLCRVLHRRRRPRLRQGIEVATWLAVAGTLVTLTGLGGFFASPPAQFALGAALGGAAGNILDHTTRHGVVDFLKCGNWPVFNLADGAITAGVPAALLWIS